MKPLLSFFIILNLCQAIINYGKAVIQVPKYLNGYFLISDALRTWFGTLLTNLAGDDFIMKYTVFEEIDQNEVCRIIFHDTSDVVKSVIFLDDLTLTPA